jgi:hypothetical protein
VFFDKTIPVIDLSRLKVLFLIALVPLAIFKEIFGHRYQNHDREGQRHRRTATGNRYSLDALHAKNDEKVNVRHLRKLLYQILGQECQEGVL